MTCSAYRESYERGLRLEPFTRNGFAIQAKQISCLVAENREWLETVQPGTVHRYRNPVAASRHILRLAAAANEGLRAYIVRKENVAAGLATVIFDQHIRHPEVGDIRGSDLDYWVTPGMKQSSHRGIAHMLVRKSQQMSRLAVFATVPVDHPNPAWGFRHELEPIGDPAYLTSETRDDVAKSDGLVQVYGLNLPLTV